MFRVCLGCNPLRQLKAAWAVAFHSTYACCLDSLTNACICMHTTGACTYHHGYLCASAPQCACVSPGFRSLEGPWSSVIRHATSLRERCCTVLFTNVKCVMPWQGMISQSWSVLRRCCGVVMTALPLTTFRCEAAIMASTSHNKRLCPPCGAILGTGFVLVKHHPRPAHTYISLCRHNCSAELASILLICG